jgi:hypothetical protein
MAKASTAAGVFQLAVPGEPAGLSVEQMIALLRLSEVRIPVVDDRALWTIERRPAEAPGPRAQASLLLSLSDGRCG